MLFVCPECYRGDPLGDAWAQDVQRVWAQMREVDPALTAQAGAYEIWQWALCKSAGMESRVVASPQACAIAGTPIPESEAFRALMRLSDRVHEELFAAVDAC